MVPTIVEMIEKEIDMFKKLVGIKPNVVYLGSFEAEQWRQDTSDKVLDVIIKQVTDVSHIGCGI